MPSVADPRLADFLTRHGLFPGAAPDSVQKIDPDALTSLKEAMAGKAGAGVVLTDADLAFCTVATEKKLGKPADLLHAIALQRKLFTEGRLRRPLGEILCGLGRLSPSTIGILTREVRARMPETKAILLDPVLSTEDQDARVRLAMEKGNIFTEKETNTCLRLLGVYQRLGLTRKPAEILLSTGVLTPEKIQGFAAPPAPAPRARTSHPTPVRPRTAHPTPSRPVRSPAAPGTPGEEVVEDRPRRRPSNRWLAPLLSLTGAVVLVGGAVAFFLHSTRNQGSGFPDVVAGGSSKPKFATAEDSNAGNTASGAGTPEVRLPSSALASVMRDVRTQFRNRSFIGAGALCETLLRRGADDMAERPEFETLNAKVQPMIRAFDALIAAIQDRHADPIVYPFANGVSWKLESADRDAVVLGSTKVDLHPKTPWTKVSSEDLYGMLVATGAAEKEPLGAAVFHRQYLGGAGADAVLAKLPEDQRKLFDLWFTEAPVEVAHGAGGSKSRTPEDPIDPTPDGTSGQTPGGEPKTPDPVAGEAERAAREARAAEAQDAIVKALALAAVGQTDDALRALATTLTKLTGTDQETPVRAAYDEMAAPFVARLSDFDSAPDFDRWQALLGKFERTESPTHVKAGTGAAAWEPGNEGPSGLLFAPDKKDWTSHPYLSLWVHSETKTGFTFEVRASGAPEHGFSHMQVVDWTGWKKLRLPRDKFRKLGSPEWSNIQQLAFMHYPDAPAGAITIDEVRLEAETVPAALGGGAEPGGGGNTPGGTPENGGPAGTGKKTPGTFGVGKKWPRPTGRHWVSLEHGLAIVPPSGWKSIPAPKEVNAEYRQQESIKTVIRFDDKNPDPQNFSINMELSIIPEAASLDDAVKTFLNAGRQELKPTNVAPFRIGPWTAQTFQIPGRFYHNVVVVYESGRAAVMDFSSGEKYGIKKAEQFRALSRTFLFVSDKDVEQLRSRQKGQTNLPEGWKVHNTPNYEIQYNTDDAFAREVGKHLEAILKEYKRRWALEASMDEITGEISSDIATRFTVKMFKTQEDFNSYAASNGVGGAAAYFSPMQNELVGYKTTDQGREKTFHIMYHEASHQYLHMYMGREVDIPIWLNEGVAEYFYGGEFKPDGSFLIEENKERISTIKEAIRTDTYVPLKTIMKYTQAEYYANAQICYAEGWAIAYFLWRTKDAKYVGRLDKFYDALKSSGDANAAHEQAFGDLDVDEFEADWKKYVLGL